MEEVKNEQTQSLAHTVETEKEEGEKKENVSLGKFKDVTSLLNAYNSLQSEFTKRCQRIKELEGERSQDDKTSVPSMLAMESQEQVKGEITEEEKQKLIKEYLKEVINSKAKAVVLEKDGASIKTPVNKPKTVSEAGNMLKELLEKK